MREMTMISCRAAPGLAAFVVAALLATASPVAAAFEKKYPGIKVRATRANATETAVKILNEARANRLQADLFDGTTTVVPLKAEGHVLQWLPDAAKEYPAEVKDPQGYWI